MSVPIPEIQLHRPRETFQNMTSQLALPFESTYSLLGKWKRRDPTKTALVDLDQDSKKVSWGELAVEADKISQLLSDRNIAAGDKVVILSDEIMEKLIIWLGIWRHGATVCPLNVEMNRSHLGEILYVIEPKLILVQQDLDADFLSERDQAVAQRFGSWPGEGVDKEFFTDLGRYKDGNGSDIENRNGPEDLSCIFCTSGTTSKPKSVVYNHMSYWLSGLSTLDMLGLTEDDRTLEYRSFGWNSAQILSLMPWLQVGLTMHIAKRFSRSRFFGWVRENGITFAAGVPTVVNMLLNESPEDDEIDLPTLRLMTCSTAPLSPQQWQQFESMYGVTLLQLYGMSEAGWICGNRHYRRRMGTVGPPAKHQDFQIVSSDGTPCEPGTEGEITVGGPQTCSATLSPDGVLTDLSDTRIKTGDLGIMDQDGFVAVTGRTKDLIIRGGVNIAPLEVDNLLLGHPKVHEAAAIGIPDEIYGEEVAACVVSRTGEVVTETELMDWCRKSLPEFKIPKQFLFLEELPRSDRGKVLRDELKELWNRE